jgi:hypothetical protein
MATNPVFDDSSMTVGSVLQAYSSSAAEKHLPWPCGVIAPHDYSLAGGVDPWEMQSECLMIADPSARIDVRVRAAQLGTPVVRRFAIKRNRFDPLGRVGDGSGSMLDGCEEIERELDAIDISLSDLLQWGRRLLWTIPGGRTGTTHGFQGGFPTSAAHDLWEIEAMVSITAMRDRDWVRLCVRVENHTEWPRHAIPTRERSLPLSLLGTHALLELRGGEFVSQMNPPRAAQITARHCHNVNAWPVLAGPLGRKNLMLASPIPLEDHPAISLDNPSRLFGATAVV